MAGHIVEGEKWIRERLKFLREQLAMDPPQDVRQAIEEEIAVLSRERGIRAGGRRFPRLLRPFRRDRR